MKAGNRVVIELVRIFTVEERSTNIDNCPTRLLLTNQNQSATTGLSRLTPQHTTDHARPHKHHGQWHTIMARLSLMPAINYADF